MQAIGVFLFIIGALVIVWVGPFMYGIALDPQGGWDFAVLVPYVFFVPGVLAAVAGWGLMRWQRVSLRALGAGFLASVLVLMTWILLTNFRAEEYLRGRIPPPPPVVANLPTLGAVRVSGGTSALPGGVGRNRTSFEIGEPVYAVLTPKFESPQERPTRYEWRWKAPSGEEHRIPGRWATTKDPPAGLGLRVELKVLPLPQGTKVRKTVGDWTVEFLIEDVSVRILQFTVENP